MRRYAVILTLCILPWPALAQAAIPDWCRPLPRPEYKAIKRVSISDPWFEVYEPAHGVFAIYEPHQAEETISYLIVGEKRAVLFDTGMGISDLKKVIGQLTKLPIVVLNSHTHNDHVGDNWEFPTVYGMDTDFKEMESNPFGSAPQIWSGVISACASGREPRAFCRVNAALCAHPSLNRPQCLSSRSRFRPEPDSWRGGGGACSHLLIVSPSGR